MPPLSFVLRFLSWACGLFHEMSAWACAGTITITIVPILHISISNMRISTRLDDMKPAHCTPTPQPYVRNRPGRTLSTKYHRLIILLVMLHGPRNAGCSTLLNVEAWSRLVVFFVCSLHRNTCRPPCSMLRFRRKVTRFYCSTKLSSPPENPNDFTCTSRSSRNRYERKTGEIMSSDSAIFDTEANRSSFFAYMAVHIKASIDL